MLNYNALLPQAGQDQSRRQNKSAGRIKTPEKRKEHEERFFQVYADRIVILHPPGSRFATNFSPQLTWSHYRALMRVSRPAAREFYEREAIVCGWGKTTVRRMQNKTASTVTQAPPMPTISWANAYSLSNGSWSCCKKSGNAFAQLT